MLSVYASQACIGFVLARGKSGYESFDRAGRSCGLFKSQPDAVAALAPREGQP
jgi:hypothetical protein